MRRATEMTERSDLSRPARMTEVFNLRDGLSVELVFADEVCFVLTFLCVSPCFRRRDST